ncbi:MAG: hypothetical protein LBG92_03940 [Prevotellaceae bacterium]|nr:hypothetical protein [Prevotellaceae bacterium]
MFATLLAVVLAGFSSCGSSKEEDVISGTGDIPSYDGYKYSELTISQQKEKLQDDADSFLSEIQDLKTNKGIDLLSEFSRLLEINSPKISKVSLRSASDILKISDMYGIYTWNKSKKDWDYLASTKELAFNFPVDNQEGKIVVSGKDSGVTFALDDEDYLSEYPEDYDYGYVDIPKEVSASLYLDATLVGSVQGKTNVSGTNKIPSLSEVSFVLDNYTLTANMTKGNPNVANFSLKKGSKILIEATGNLSGNVDDAMSDESSIGNGNMVIKILENKLAFAGTVDFEKYFKALNEADEKWDVDYEQGGYELADENFTKAEVKAFNDYYNLFLVSLEDQTKIATLKQKAKEVSYGWGYYYWDAIAMLKFNDSTEVEAEVFFSEGFDFILNKWKEFINGFE